MRVAGGRHFVDSRTHAMNSHARTRELLAARTAREGDMGLAAATATTDCIGESDAANLVVNARAFCC